MRKGTRIRARSRSPRKGPSNVITDAKALGTEGHVVDGYASHRRVTLPRLELQEVLVVYIVERHHLAVPRAALILERPPDALAVILVWLQLDEVEAQGDCMCAVLLVTEPYLRTTE
jgi:hypothetical protein